MKFTADMTIGEVIKNAKDPMKLQAVFLSVGMHCLGCALATGETVAEAAQVHGLDVNELVAKLNEANE